MSTFLSAVSHAMAAFDRLPGSVSYLIAVLSVLGLCWMWQTQRGREDDGPPDVHGSRR